MKNLRIRFKMLVLVGVAVALVIGIGAAGLTTTDKMAERAQATYEQALLPVAWASQIQLNNQKIDTHIMQIIVSGDPVESAELAESIRQLMSVNDGLMIQLQPIRYRNTATGEAYGHYQDLLPQYRSDRDEVIRIGLEDRQGLAYILFNGDFRQIRTEMTAYLQEYNRLL